MRSFGQAVSTDAEAKTHINLVWLMLHEMHHFQMGHFDNNLELNLPMTGSDKEYGLVKRTAKHSETQTKAGAASGLILAMKADHDATEMLLDAYSSDEWISLRIRIAAISATMMLIERADSSNQTPVITHPKAATRIFQLLGHVIDMPLLAAHSKANQGSGGLGPPADPPPHAERENYVAQVVVSAFFDAVSLAKFVAAGSITNDLGSATVFFQDIRTAKLVHNSGPSEFITAGARQWANLASHRSQTST
ncbi:MAG: hypothetical protein ACRBBS_05555 [Thalassovita sp.]